MGHGTNLEDEFIHSMEYGTKMIWTPERKNSAFILNDGKRVCDASLHDKTYLKSNIEMLVAFLELNDFRPSTEEPADGWLSEIISAEKEDSKLLHKEDRGSGMINELDSVSISDVQDFIQRGKDLELLTHKCKRWLDESYSRKLRRKKAVKDSSRTCAPRYVR